MDNVQKINIQPPDWVGDAIAFVVLLSINALLRSVKSHIWKHMPVWIWSFITWVVMTVLFIDLNIIRKVLKKVLPFVDHFLSGISLTDKWLLVPLPLKLLLWALLSLGLGWQAWTSTKDGPLGKKQRAHALRMVDGLYNTGYLMQDECVLLKHILNEPLLFKEAVALKLLSCLRTILIKGETADACVPCRALVQVVRSTGKGGKGGTGDEWPAPLTTGPLQELGDVELKQMHEAVRVWLRATQRDGRAKYAALKEINVEIIHHFSRQCHTAKRKLVKQDVDMMVNSLLVKRLKEHIGPAGLKFNQYKMLWQWYCTVVAMINSDATVQKAWDERWVAGFVDRRESEEMLKQSGAGSVLFRFTSDINFKKKFNLCASVYSSDGKIIHSLIEPKPMEEIRFLIPTKKKDANGHTLFTVQRFKTFKNIFTTYETWKIFTPSGVRIRDVNWN